MAFCNKVVLITGASSGIGAATALHFAELGASLVLTGRNEKNLDKIGQTCKSKRRKPILIPADLTKEEDIQKIIKTTICQCERLDILVNNAGILANGGIENLDLKQFDQVINTNVKSVYHLTSIATPHLIRTKGNIINVSSIAGSRSFPGILSYSMSKAAINIFTKCVALELGSKHVRCNAVNPSVVATDLYLRSGLSQEQYKDFLENSKSKHILGRVAKPEEIARTIAFLASDKASFITGACIPVDGGRQIMFPR